MIFGVNKLDKLFHQANICFVLCELPEAPPMYPCEELFPGYITEMLRKPKDMVEMLELYDAKRSVGGLPSRALLSEPIKGRGE